MRWRSPREIAYRLKQEARNAMLAVSAPMAQASWMQAIPSLPDPASAVAAIRCTRIADDIVAIAKRVMEHRFPLLGLEIETGAEIHWRRDYLGGQETEPVYFRKVPYLDAARAGDHKIIWELNRHQHLVLLAQAYRLSGRPEFVREIEQELTSWIAANPFQRGINWTSALEVAFRALSWVWILRIAGDELTAVVRAQMSTGLFQHGLHLANNLSYYFSPNTHLLGEAVALHALGILFGGSPTGKDWQALGANVVAQEMERQVGADGSHFEKSSYYHVYAVDMFLFHAILERPGAAFLARLARMGEYLEALLGPGRLLPNLGDDDGGRFFHPYGERERFGRATLAACGTFFQRPEWIADPADLHEIAVWWGECRAEEAHPRALQSILFRDAGIIAMVSTDRSCIVDAGPFGPYRSGHSHSDTLSIVARRGERDLLIDSGTFTYVGDMRWRNVFRGSGAHNTLRIDSLDQADPAGPFGWLNPPRVAIRQWQSSAESDYLDAECRYRECRHRRRILFLKPDLLFVLDVVEGAALVEQFWHPGGVTTMRGPAFFEIRGEAALVLDTAGTIETPEGSEWNWRSRAFGVKEPAPLIVKRLQGSGAKSLGAVFAFAKPVDGTALTLAGAGGEVELLFIGQVPIRVVFAESGARVAR